MKFHSIFESARSIVIELVGDDYYYNTDVYEIYLNGSLYGTSDKVVTSIYGLTPDTEYEIELKKGTETSKETVYTKKEFVTLNVRDFGAKGDGKNNDTAFIQAAIMSCPANSRVYVPRGVYRITGLFLKSDFTLELAEGAELQGIYDEELIPLLPGRIESYDETDEYHLASWEGNPLESKMSIITGINVENVVICGQGTINGNAGFDNWWVKTRTKQLPARPRMVFLNNCKNVIMQGVTITNSPAWNMHPFFSENLKFIDLKILSPDNSCNTDGIDPESCNHVEIVGVYFSVGDDCIAIKSGKVYMGKKYKTPSRNFDIRHSYMMKGHGAVTVGSEIAGGVKDIYVRNCEFYDTDRGLRVKTRRGRGEDSVLKDIVFENIKMDHVMTPFVVNCFYFCDPDGRTEYVACKDALPVDERTPVVESLRFKNIEAKNCHVAAAYFYGLPERKIGEIEMENIHVTYAENAREEVAAMMIGCERGSKQGVFARNVEKLILKNVTVEGCVGKEFDIDAE